jgi:DNA-binding GntR family transcriptional regulator
MLERERLSETGLPAHERLYRSLRGRIMHGLIAPGQPLTIRGLAVEFGVSMTPAREAVRRLVAEGGLRLSPSGRIATPELSNDRIEELAALRALLEPELASRALPRAHIALIDRMAAINGLVEETIVKGDASGYVRANLEFHRTLYLRAQAPAILGLLETVWLQSGPTMRVLYERLQRRQATENHRNIIAALRAGDDPGLRLAIRVDVTHGLRMLLG